jgi:hypothetical protein
MLGQYIRNIDVWLISEEDTLLWLSRGIPETETAFELTAIPDQALKNKYHAKKCWKQKQIANADCQQYDETIG